jgi:hypothetical protein
MPAWTSQTSYHLCRWFSKVPIEWSRAYSLAFLNDWVFLFTTPQGFAHCLYFFVSGTRKPNASDSPQRFVISATDASVFIDGLQVIDEEPWSNSRVSFEIPYSKNCRTFSSTWNNIQLVITMVKKAPLTVSRVHNMLLYRMSIAFLIPVRPWRVTYPLFKPLLIMISSGLNIMFTV